MPQFAWANDPSGRRGGHDVRAGADQRAGHRPVSAARRIPRRRKTAVAEGSKVLNRLNCTGCHVLEMPKFTIPAGVKVAEAIHQLQGQPAVFLHGAGHRLPGRALSRR